MAKRRLVTPGEVSRLYAEGGREIRVPRDAILSPGAKDLIRMLDMKLVFDEGPPPEADGRGAGPGADPLSAQVRRLVAELGPELDEHQRDEAIRTVMARVSAGVPRR